MKSVAKRSQAPRTHFQATSKFVLFIIFLLLPAFAHADEPRWKDVFTSANGKYVLRYISGTHVKKLTAVSSPFFAESRDIEERYRVEKWSLREKKTGKELYTLEGHGLGTQTLLVSDDGAFVVAVDDFSERIPVKELSVLAFYTTGKLQKSYTIGDLFLDMRNLHFSVSHFSPFDRGPRPTILPDFKLSLETNESMRYVFDIRTGEVLSKIKNESAD